MPVPLNPRNLPNPGGLPAYVTAVCVCQEIADPRPARLIIACGIELESRGRRTLKGVPERRLVFAVSGLVG